MVSWWRGCLRQPPRGSRPRTTGSVRSRHKHWVHGDEPWTDALVGCLEQENHIGVMPLLIVLTLWLTALFVSFGSLCT